MGGVNSHKFRVGAQPLPFDIPSNLNLQRAGRVYGVLYLSHNYYISTILYVPKICFISIDVVIVCLFSGGPRNLYNTSKKVIHICIK